MAEPSPIPDPTRPITPVVSLQSLLQQIEGDLMSPHRPEPTPEQLRIRELTRLAKSPGVLSNLALAGQYYAEINTLREQIKAQKGAIR